MGRPDEAAACHRRALELKPDFAEANGNLGNALRDQGKLDQAIACYRRALELKPGFARAYGNLGNVLRDRGELEQAIGCYRRALELNPDYAMGHRNLGAALQEQGKLDEAAASYRRALELKADYAEAHSNLGDVLRKQGTLAEAIACYGRALSLKPDFAEAHGNLGCALVDLGDMQDAEDSFRAALRHDGCFAFAHYKLADLRDGKLPAEDLAAQRRLLQEADLTAVQRLLLYFSLARVLDVQGDYAEAAEHLRGATRCNFPSGASAASSTIRKHTSLSSPARSRSARPISSGGSAASGWKASCPCLSWGCRGPARRSSSRSWPAMAASSARARSGWPTTR